MSRKNREKREHSSKKKEFELPMTIVHHPAKQKPMLAAVVLAFLAVMIFSLFSSFNQMIIIPLILIFIVIHGLLPFFFPTNITFTKEGIELKRLGRSESLKWSDYRAYTVQHNGVVLWMDMRPADAKSSFSEHLKSMRRSMFIPLTQNLMEDAESVLSRNLVKIS